MVKNIVHLDECSCSLYPCWVECSVNANYVKLIDNISKFSIWLLIFRLLVLSVVRRWL